MKVSQNLYEKTANVFNRCFFGVFAVLSVIIILPGFIVTAFTGEVPTDAPIPIWMGILRYLLVLGAFAGVSALLVVCYNFLSSKTFDKTDNRRTNTAIIFMGVGLILAIQFVFMYLLRMNPITDVKIVEDYALKIAEENSFECIDSGFRGYYLVKYQNNLAITLILSFLYKVSYLLTGEYSQMLILVVNTLAINISILMTVLIARRILGERNALYTLVLCALFAPFYSYTAYYYSDTLSLPFVTGTVYAFVVAVQGDRRIKKLALLILSGMLCFVGFKIKGSVIVFLPAVLIYLVLKNGIKRSLVQATAFVMGFVVLFASFSVYVKSSKIISQESSDRYQYPATHWVMMGLKDLGAYNKEDSDFTASFTTKSEKSENNIDQIINRVSEKGIHGMVYHIGFKSAWTWMDGTYYVGYYLRDYKQHNILHEFILYDGQYRYLYFAVTSGFKLFMLIMMGYSALAAARKKKLDIMTFLRIAIIGIYLFLLMWEANSRYPFNFSPLYLIVATEGVSEFVKRLSQAKNKKADILEDALPENM